MEVLSEFATQETNSKILGRMFDVQEENSVQPKVESRVINTELRLSEKFSEEAIRVINFYVENHPKCPEEIKNSEFPSQFFLQFSNNSEDIISVGSEIIDCESGKELKFVGVDTSTGMNLYRWKDCSESVDHIDYFIKPRDFGGDKVSFFRKVRNFFFDEN